MSPASRLWNLPGTAEEKYTFSRNCGAGCHSYQQILKNQFDERLWRFNVGTPLKGAPVTYAVGPKQYVAVQGSGRHVHPVKYDNLETSSYLFVFALD
jgi:hypothetical protein